MKQIKRSVVRTLFCLSALLMFADIANACGCPHNTTVLDDYEEANLVVVARFVSVTKTDNPKWLINDIGTASMIVERVYKGDIKTGDELIFEQGDVTLDCSWTLYEQEIGTQYPLHAFVDEQGRFVLTVLGEVQGEVFGQFSPNDRDFVLCPPYKELIRNTGEKFVIVETQHVEVDGTKDLPELVLRYPVPPCNR